MITALEKHEPRYLDPSGFSTFTRCPAKYYFSRVLGLQQPGLGFASAPDFGTCIHLALPLCYSRDTLQEAQLIFAEAWKGYGYGESDPKRNTARGCAMLENFCRSRADGRAPYEILHFPAVTPPTAKLVSKDELPFLVDVGADLPLAGRIDLAIRWKVDGKVYPCDYKGQPMWAEIATPTGFTAMGNLSPGMTILGSNGAPQEVLAIFPLGKRKIFKVTFSDGAVTHCTDDHLWLVKKRQRKGQQLKELRDIVNEGVLEGSHRMFSVPLTGPCEFEPQPVLLDPYLVGVLVGDGCKSKIHCNDLEIVERIQKRNPELNISTNKGNGKHDCFYHCISGIRSLLENYNLLQPKAHEKQVPCEYLLNSPQVRREVLKGLMDTDGSVSCHGTPVFTTTSSVLARDVRFLVESLGGTCTVNRYTSKVSGRVYGEYYMCIIHLNDVFALERKASKVVEDIGARAERKIVSVEPAGEHEAQCIKVSNADGLYITDDFIVTHNTTSEMSDRLFESFWNCPQALAYTLAMFHLTGEQSPGLMIEAIKVSPKNDEVALFPVTVDTHLLERFVEEFKVLSANLLACSQSKQWPRNCAMCSSYAAFGVPGFTCPYKNLCSVPDWTVLLPTYQQGKIFHPFEIED